MSNPDVQARDAGPAPIFAALGDRTRLSLLTRLSDGNARSIAALSADTRLTRQAVRVGRENRFGYRPGSIEQARAYLDGVSAQWDDAISRLRAFVEN
jgi:DNA-binding transcriptional ArsR family regulator